MNELERLHELFVIFVAVGEAEDLSQGFNALIKGNHVPTAVLQQSGKAGRRREWHKRHAHQPPAQAALDDEGRKAGLQASNPKVMRSLFYSRIVGQPGLLPFVSRPGQKDVSIIYYLIAIVDCQVDTLPLNALEFPWRQALSEAFFRIGMKSAVERFHIQLDEEGKNIVRCAPREATHMVINKMEAGYGNQCANNDHCERLNIHDPSFRTPSAFR